MSAPARLSARDLDALVMSASAVTDEDLAGLVDSPAADVLFDSVVSEGIGPAELVVLPRRHGRRSSAPALLAAAVLLVAGVLGPLLAFRSAPPTAGEIEVPLSTKTGASFTGVVPRRSVLHGRADWRSLPTFVDVDVAGQVVGVVRRADLDGSAFAATGASGATGASAASGASGANGYVCGEGGVQVLRNPQGNQVGWLYPGAGYVPLGEKPVCGQATGVPPLSTLVPIPQCPVLIAGSGQIYVTQCGSEGGGETKRG